jgi:hypothetical protein
MKVPTFTITNESVTVVWEGTPYVVRKGSPQFLALRKAIMDENWDAVPKNLTVKSSLKEWAKGKFSIISDSEGFAFNDTPLPAVLNQRILQMATAGSDPGPLFKFWERLQQNPSFRSVNQLYEFLKHEGIPLTKDGCFLAYKSIKSDYKDHHTGTVDNKPGTINEMPRNKISDDPKLECDEGFHVGALQYVKNFGSGPSRVVVCKVDPKDVVCVPYDNSQHKMRVCRYEVKGHWNGQQLPNTTFIDDFDGTDAEDVAINDDEIQDEAAEEESPEAEADRKVDEKATAAKEKRKSKSGFAKFDKMGFEELLNESIADLRKYATKGLTIVGASKISGGKVALIQKILEVRA